MGNEQEPNKLDVVASMMEQKVDGKIDEIFLVAGTVEEIFAKDILSGKGGLKIDEAGCMRKLGKGHNNRRCRGRL